MSDVGIAVSLVGDREVLRKLTRHSEGTAQISKPVPATDVALPLDSPLNPADVKAILEVITVVLKSGAALGAFATSVLAVLGESKPEAEEILG
jgi:hypothetical protein